MDGDFGRDRAHGPLQPGSQREKRPMASGEAVFRLSAQSAPNALSPSPRRHAVEVNVIKVVNIQDYPGWIAALAQPPGPGPFQVQDIAAALAFCFYSALEPGVDDIGIRPANRLHFLQMFLGAAWVYSRRSNEGAGNKSRASAAFTGSLQMAKQDT